MELVPPFDNLAEGQVLGAVLLGGLECLAEVREVLTASTFYTPAHGSIFAAALSLADRGAPVDAASVAQELRTRGQLDRIGQGTADADGHQYLADLLDGTPDAGNAAYYARIVRGKAKLRAMISVAERLRRSAYAQGAEAEAVLAEAQEAVYELCADVEAGGTMTAAEAGRRVLERADRVQQGQEPAGLSLGFRTLDAASGGGLRPGQLLVVAAGTSVGKSSLAACFAANVARHAHTVKVFSAEMAAEEIAQRWLAMLSGVPGLKIGNGRALRENDWAALREAQAELERWGAALEVTDRPMTIEAMAGEVRRFRAKLGRSVDLAIIDYLQILPGDGATERERVNAISRGAKLLAKTLRVPVVLLSQLSRAHQTQDRRPELFDLKESSNIEQDADAVLLLHRPQGEEGAPDPFGGCTVLARIAKMRNGATTEWDGPSAIRLRWNPKLTQFVEYAQADAQDAQAPTEAPA